MKKILTKNNRQNSYWMILVLLILFLLSYFYITKTRDLIYQNIYQNIKELSEQTATQLNLSITEQKRFVEIMVDSINRGYFKTPEEIFDRFKEDLPEYHFTRLVILDTQGNGTTSDGHIVSNYTNIEEFFQQKEVYVSENRPSTVSNNQVNIYAKVFWLNGEEKVLMATINTQDYQNILLRRLFGKGGTYLINNDGLVLIDSFNRIKQENLNIYEYIKQTYELKEKKEIAKIENMQEKIKAKEVGTFDIKLGDEIYFIHYEKVNINDWYVVTTAANSTIAKELIMLIMISQGLCLFISFTIIAICIYIDQLNQKKNRKLYKVAYIDPITSLGNEQYFKEKGNIYLKKQNTNSYLLSMDINKFKALNNQYGYPFCDKILKTLGEKLVEILPNNAIVCRISGDIFAAIFSDEKDKMKILEKLAKEASYLIVENKKIQVNLSIGVYPIKPEDTDINKIIDKAYMARKKIKGLYDKTYYIFDKILEDQLIEEQKIESSMENALKNKEFKVVYQPKIFTTNETLAGAEALVRWEKEGNTILPNKFIPLFEKNKFIIKLDLYVFEQVCKDLAEWKDKYNYIPTISINVSKAHFANENFIEEYVKITNKYQIERNKIDLEITESATVDKELNIIAILNNIKAKGFMISIDDFGTGYSSLSMLQNMPIDIIKIDKVFMDKANLKSDKNMINYIMLLALQLGIRTIVEGVENKEQVEFVKKIKTDMIQGYYYSKPIGKEQLEKYFFKNS